MTATVKEHVDKVSIKTLGIAAGASFVSALVFKGLYNLSSGSNTTVVDGELMQRGGEALGQNMANELKKISVKAKLMPSQINETNSILLEYQPKGEESGAEDFFDEGKVDDINSDFYSVTSTGNLIPSMKLNSDYVPLGSAKPMCLNLSWIPLSKKNQVDKYLDIQGFETCNDAKNNKIRWDAQDPTQGLEFKPWIQRAQVASSESDCNNENAIFSRVKPNHPGRCYDYQIMQRICVLVKYVEHPETASYTWEYAGGCFENNEFIKYGPAESGQVYDFDSDKRVEVRQINVGLVESSTSGGGFFWFLYFISVIVFVASLAAFVFKQVTKSGGISAPPKNNFEQMDD